MKLNKIYSVITMAFVAFIAACNTPPLPPEPPGPGDETVGKLDTMPIPESITIPEGAITVAQAREICAGLENEQITEERYYVHGWIRKLHGSNESAITGDYHNAQFYICEYQMKDSLGTITYSTDDFYAYRVKGPDNSNITDVDAVQVGDYVVLYCKLTKYNDTYETPMNSGSYIYASTNENLKGAQPITDAVDMTVAEAIAKAKNKETCNARLTVTVQAVKTAKENVPGTYTNINMTVKDATGSIDCFYTNYLENKPFTSADQIPPVGSQIKVVGPLILYKDSVPEISNGYIEEIIKIGDGSGEIITDATVLANVAEAIEKAKTKPTGNFKLTAEVKEVATLAANVPSKYTNINMTLKDETGEIACYYTNYLENKPFTSAEQIPPVGTKLIIVGPLVYFNDQTPEFSYAYIEEILEVGQGEPPLEGDVTIKFDGTGIGDWTFSETKAEFYGDGGLKLNKEGMTITSPAFEAAAGVKVEFEIGKLNTNQATGKNGENGSNFIVGFTDAEGNVLEDSGVKTSAVGKYTVDLTGENGVKVFLKLESFPYNGSKYCNVNLKSIAITRK